MPEPLTILAIIERLFPEGTNKGRPKDISKFPTWPPDAFALAATVARLSGCYSRPRYTKVIDASFFSEKKLKDIRNAALKWRKTFSDKKGFKHIQSLWDVLISTKDSLHANDPKCVDWWDAVMELLVIADEASDGIGFFTTYDGFLARFTRDAHFEMIQRKKWNVTSEKLPYIHHSNCMMVPPSEACVHPKSRTPQSGCTLRSFSHHLALLPPIGDVDSSWSLGCDGSLKTGTDDDPHQLERKPLNILLVPFPYHFDGKNVVPGKEFFAHQKASPRNTRQRQWRFFDLNQSWLVDEKGKPIRVKTLVDYLKKLIEQAKQEVNKVDGIIFPELSLNDKLVKGIARKLAEETEVELFVAGFLDQRSPIARNMVHGSIIQRNPESKEPSVRHIWEQSKHHRWMLERNQIERYHLGERLHPDYCWWENINIERRECGFWVLRGFISLVTLVCEDLARIDPVQFVIRAIGPTLVIALLLDGPQLPFRWSARYSTVLADDPGCAVLTLTSLGMIRRQHDYEHGNEEKEDSRKIALWKGAEGKTREIILLPEHHGVLLTLSPTYSTNYTLDGRSDRGATISLELSETRQIKIEDTDGYEVPSWATAK